MKKIPFAMLGALALACTTTGPDPNPDPVVLNISPTSLDDIDSGGAQTTVEVECNYDFTVTVLTASPGQWLSFEKGSAAGGKTPVAFTVAANYTSGERKASVSFRSGDIEKILSLSQVAPTVEVSGDPLDFGYTGGTRYLTVTASVPEWSARVMEGEWCTVAKDADGRLAVTAAANTTSASRQTAVRITVGDNARTIAVSQNSLTFEISTSTLDFEYSGGTKTVTVTTDEADWSVAVPPGVTWCSAVNTGEGEIYVTTMRNTTTENRTVVLTLTAGHITREIVVTQTFLSVVISPTTLDFEYSGGTKTVTVTTNATNWSAGVSGGSSWCSAARSGGGIAVTAQPNSAGARSGMVRLIADHITRDIPVTQAEMPGSYADKQVVRLQQATVGTGVNVIIMGDGYVISDMTAGGKYETQMRAAMEHFFSTYPYSAYRDYFNVWMVVAVSNQAGLSTESPSVTVDTVFGCIWAGPNSGSTRIGFIDDDDSKAIAYARLAADVAGKPMTEMTVIIPINANVYAGTCWMYYDNFSLSLCPVGSYYKEVVVHETGGHGFGKLMDEYIYYSGTIPSNYKTSIQNGKQYYGWYANVDFYSDITQTTWADFAGRPEYSMVGTWEGAYMYSKGIWRPEYNSCMNNNVFYFNAPSRYAQMDRIHKWAGMSYSFTQFLQDDIIPPYPAPMAGSGVLRQFVPLAPPVFVERSSTGR